MKIVPFIISAAVTTGLTICLSIPLGSIPPIGSLLSPQEGFWQNAEPADQDYSESLQLPALKEKASVYFDERLVPHVFAQNDEDLYYIQGYLHAKFRLWQMEFQTHVAAGRLTEILGVGAQNAILNNDRNMRRLGMVHAATNSLDEMESDTTTKKVLDAYTAGVNAYVDQINSSNLPLEYRLLNYHPEHWTNLKTALFLKYMSYDLTGAENDIEYTNAKAVLGKVLFDKMYPVTQDSLDPILPKGTVFAPATVHPVMPASADSLYFQWKDTAAITPLSKPDKDNGSNNWAVSGEKTQSGSPILCNDPHLGLNLPSLWFEMQLHTPQSNAYGVSFPGSPAIIIGFTDRIAWGVTNGSRDVKDYYAIQFKDESKKEYKFNEDWKEAELKIEEYKIKGQPSKYDTVAYTIFGPVQYDASFNGNGRAAGSANLAVRWKAHDASNEFKTFYLLNRAQNYTDYLSAIQTFACPGQNFVFASKDNQVAIWQQGSFPAKWHRQGDFIMPGTDSSYMWQQMIPQSENPHMDSATSRGFVSSANQLPADTSYPYYLGGNYDLYRGFIINRKLRQMNGITVEDMEKLQTENYNVFAEMALPVMLRNIQQDKLDAEEKTLYNTVAAWNKRNDTKEKGVAIFLTWFDKLETEVWSDELKDAPQPIIYPDSYTLVESLLKGPAFAQADNIQTPDTETVSDVVTAAFKKAIPAIKDAAAQGKLEWGKYKDTRIRHLLRQEPLSRLHLNIGGGQHVINATKESHGPSWRMIVQLSDKTEAKGIYPGGQQGNPGSRYYDNFVNDWAAGKYHTLWMMEESEAKSANVKYTINFTK